MSCLRFQALYNYTPRNEDELELRESDVIDVMEKCDDGWFVGMCTLPSTPSFHTPLAALELARICSLAMDKGTCDASDLSHIALHF